MYALGGTDEAKYCCEACITADYPVHSIEAIISTSLGNIDHRIRLLLRLIANQDIESKTDHFFSNPSELQPGKLVFVLDDVLLCSMTKIMIFSQTKQLPKHNETLL